MKAIIVEDEIFAAIHAEATLERLGVEVIGTAEDTTGALSLAGEKPHLALVDLNLRDGFTGPTIARHLAQNGIQVVFVTANPSMLDEVDRVPALVLEKPLDEPALAEALRRVSPGEAGVP